MRKFLLTLVISSVLATGCAGKQDTSGLQDALAACESEKSALASELESMKSENARLKKSADRAAALAKARKKNLDDLRAKLQELIDAGDLTITIRNGMIVLQLPSGILFDSGKASLKDEAKETLETVAGALSTVQDRRFFIAGHTDNVPVSKKAKTFKSNWELSTMRALSVQRFITSAGVGSEFTAVVGLADTDPIGDNETDEGKAQNRRTEIMLMPDFSILIPEVTAMKSAKPDATAEEAEEKEM